MNEIREKIDALDIELARLLSKRLALVDDIARVKRSSAIPIRDERREAEVLKHVSEAAGEAYAEDVRRIYDAIFEIARQRQIM